MLAKIYAEITETEPPVAWHSSNNKSPFVEERKNKPRFSEARNETNTHSVVWDLVEKKMKYNPYASGWGDNQKYPFERLFYKAFYKHNILSYKMWGR